MLLSLIICMMDQLVLKCTVEDEPEVECDECFRDKPIEAFCTDCSSFLCHGCIDYHTYSKQLKDHHLVTLMSQSNKSLAVSCSTAAPDPQQCQTIDAPKSTIIGKKAEFTIITRDNNGDRCFREGTYQVSVLLKGVNNTIVERISHIYGCSLCDKSTKFGMEILFLILYHFKMGNMKILYLCG